MKITKCTANLMVEDVNATITYYETVLGFQIIMCVPETGTRDWAMMQREGMDIMFQSRTSIVEDMGSFADHRIGEGMAFFIEVEGLDAWYDALKDTANIVMDKRTTFYGMNEFGIQDCNGYMLVFAERVETGDA